MGSIRIINTTKWNINMIRHGLQTFNNKPVELVITQETRQVRALKPTMNLTHTINGVPTKYKVVMTSENGDGTTTVTCVLTEWIKYQEEDMKEDTAIETLREHYKALPRTSLAAKAIKALIKKYEQSPLNKSYKDGGIIIIDRYIDPYYQSNAMMVKYFHNQHGSRLNDIIKTGDDEIEKRQGWIKKREEQIETIKSTQAWARRAYMECDKQGLNAANAKMNNLIAY